MDEQTRQIVEYLGGLEEGPERDVIAAAIITDRARQEGREAAKALAIAVREALSAD